MVIHGLPLLQEEVLAMVARTVQQNKEITVLSPNSPMTYD